MLAKIKKKIMYVAYEHWFPVTFRIEFKIQLDMKCFQSKLHQGINPNVSGCSLISMELYWLFLDSTPVSLG